MAEVLGDAGDVHNDHRIVSLLKTRSSQMPTSPPGKSDDPKKRGARRPLACNGNALLA